MIVKKIVLSAAFCGLVFLSCKKQKAPEPIQIVESDCADTISYNNFIAKDIINMSCNTTYCHAGGAGGYTWDSHQVVSDNADLIYDVMRHAPGAKQMPYGGQKLPDSLITKFKCWIDQGKLDN